MATEDEWTREAVEKACASIAAPLSCEQTEASVLTADGETSPTSSTPRCAESTGEQRQPVLSRSNLGAVAVVSSSQEPQLWYCCPHCERMCPNRNTLAVHVRIHMEDKPFKCALCLSAFATKAYLIEHVKRHSSGKALMCNVCFQPSCTKHDITLQFRRRPSVERVFRSDHRNKAIAVYTGVGGPNDGRPYGTPNTCDRCKMSFACLNDLQKHLLTTHGNLKAEDGDSYGDSSKLPESFAQIHGNPKLHMCHLCPARFTRNYSLVVHLRTHADDRQHGCEQCSKRFVTISRLREHIRAAHSAQPTFSCKYCSTKCAWRSSLTYHMKKFHPGSA